MKFDNNASEEEKRKFYEAEEQQFLKELNDGEFSIEILENKGTIREKKETDDITAFEACLESEDFEFFHNEVSRK
jgi:hypothetical protein